MFYTDIKYVFETKGDYSVGISGDRMIFQWLYISMNKNQLIETGVGMAQLLYDIADTGNIWWTAYQKEKPIAEGNDKSGRLLKRITED